MQLHVSGSDRSKNAGRSMALLLVTYDDAVVMILYVFLDYMVMYVERQMTLLGFLRARTSGRE